ncbi:MAG: peptidase S41 [Pseudopedobacter saltans]|uniref:Peptidase S41 n=1 Tax=Pseudopedobacter saltans TaxID=151895 RepID=A0A2W5FG68_9SPHI|nr:MAG: peptidase S41 [Pseudopedobacter saltans]
MICGNKRQNFILLSLFCLLFNCKPKNKDIYNLSFERTIKDSAIGWHFANRRMLSLDSEVVKSGHYSMRISLMEDTPSGGLVFQPLAGRIKGDSITLSGYIKTENVREGFAGLWMAETPNIAFNNMYSQGLKGTTDWTKYKITLPLDSNKMKGIAFGGILLGKGKMWIDNLKITVDGKDISEIEIIENLPADNDMQFDIGSPIKTIKTDTNTINRLYQMGLIWGFLKYYHPSIASGKYNWDGELFRILPRVLEASLAEKDAILYNYIDTLGQLNDVNSPTISKDTSIIKTDLDWIVHSNFSEKLQKQLLSIKNSNRVPSFNYYVKESETNNALFTNERAYDYMAYPDAGFRLLALYRYWNMVQYFFPYKDIIGQDWKMVLKKYVTKFINAKNELEYKLLLVELSGEIHDSHGFVNDHTSTLYNYEGARYLPINLEFIEGKPVVFDFSNQNLAEKDGWKKGDIITEINGQSVSAIIKKWRPYTPASNPWTLLRDIATKIVRTNDSILVVKIIRNNNSLTKSVNSYPNIGIPKEDKTNISNKSYKWITNEIGYVNHGKLRKDELPTLFEQFKNAKGIVIDFRNHILDDLMYELPRYLLPYPQPFLKHLVPRYDAPGSFYFTEPYQTGVGQYNLYKGKIALIINEKTQSSAEYHTMAYRTYPKSFVIGSNSAGADGNVSEIVFPSGVKTRFSGLGIFYPNGAPTQRIGIVPDVIVKPTVKGVAAGQDEVLEKAINILNK